MYENSPDKNDCNVVYSGARSSITYAEVKHFAVDFITSRLLQKQQIAREALLHMCKVDFDFKKGKTRSDTEAKIRDSIKMEVLKSLGAVL